MNGLYSLYFLVVDFFGPGFLFGAGSSIGLIVGIRLFNFLERKVVSFKGWIVYKWATRKEAK